MRPHLPLARPRAMPLATLTALAALFALSGCSSPPTALEQSLGSSVRQAVAQQTVPPSGPRGPQRTDGVIAAHGVARYELSFQQPPAPVSVLNLLTGSGSTPASSASPTR